MSSPFCNHGPDENEKEILCHGERSGWTGFNSEFHFSASKLPQETGPDDSFESNIDRGRFL